MNVSLNLTGVNITNASYVFFGNNSVDVYLYRAAANVLGTDSIFRLVTTGASGALQFVDANARLYRSSNDLIIEASGQLRFPQETNVTGPVFIANNTAASQSNGTLYLGKNITGGWQWLRFDTARVVDSDDGPGGFVFSAPVFIPGSSPSIKFYDPKDPFNTSKMQALSYDPGNQEFSFTGGKIAQDFKNIVRNGGFESFSASGVGTFTTESVSATPDGWTLNSGTVYQFAPATYSFGSDIFQGYNSLMLNNTGNISQEVKGYKLQPGRTYSIGVWVKTNGTVVANLTVRGAALQAAFTSQSASSVTGWTLLKGQFSTKSAMASTDSITVELAARGASGFGFFDAVQLNLGTILSEYQDTPIVEVGEQIIYGGLRLQRTGLDRGGTLSVDKSIRTRQIEFSFSGDPGWGTLNTDLFHDPRYNWGGGYSQQNVYLELTGTNELRFRSPTAGTSELFIDINKPQPIIGTQGSGIGINFSAPVNFTNTVNLGSGLLIKGDTGLLGWGNLTNYPAGCPVGQAVVSIGDTITCGEAGGAGGWTLGSTVLYNNTAGANVGIGTPVATQKLNVSGNISLSGANAGIIFPDGSFMNTDDQNVSLNYVYNGTNWVGMNATSTGIVRMEVTAQMATDLICTDCIGATEITDIYLLNTGDTATGDYTFDTNTLFIDSAGDRVGIGTASPSSLLHVSGSTTAQNNALLNISNGTTASILFVNGSSGNVGIGTASPVTTLDVRGNIAISAGSDIRPTSDSTTAINIANAAGTDYVTFDTTNSRVGIGTASPSTKLEVAGAVNITQATGTSLNVSDSLYVDASNKRVGIGTASPTQRLTVSGNVNITGSGNGIFFPDGTSQTSADTNVSLNYVYNGTNWVGWNATSTGIVRMEVTSQIATDLICTNCIGGAEIDESSLSIGTGWTIGSSVLFNDTAGVNVGIGTPVANQRLNVSGNISIAGPNAGIFFPDGSFQTQSETNVSQLYGNNGTNWIGLNVTSGGILRLSVAENLSPTGSGTSSRLVRWTGTDAVGNSVITDDGANVGIGTTSPSSLLHVSGSTTAQNNALLNVSNGTTSVVLFVNGTSGSVGIGTASPTEVLMVAGNIAPSANNTYDLANSTHRWRNIWAYGNITAGDLLFSNNFRITEVPDGIEFRNPDNVPIMRLDSEGSLWIRGEIRRFDSDR